MSRPPFWVLLLMIAVPALPRLIPHPWNIAPMGALALFAGAQIRDRRWALALPLLSAFVGDLGLGLLKHNLPLYTFHTLLPVVYACYLVSVGLGIAVRKSWESMDTGQTPHAVVPRSADSADGDERGRETRPVNPWKAVPLAGATLAGAVFFFIVTNFANWVFFDTYPHTWAGLLDCYDKAIPFFRNSLMSDAFFVTALFGGFALAQRFVETTRGAELGADESRL